MEVNERFVCRFLGGRFLQYMVPACAWEGVSCSSTTGRVDQIVCVNMSLSGPLLRLPPRVPRESEPVVRSRVQRYDRKGHADRLALYGPQRPRGCPHPSAYIGIVAGLTSRS